MPRHKQLAKHNVLVSTLFYYLSDLWDKGQGKQKVSASGDFYEIVRNS